MEPVEGVEAGGVSAPDVLPWPVPDCVEEVPLPVAPAEVSVVVDDVAMVPAAEPAVVEPVSVEEVPVVEDGRTWSRCSSTCPTSNPGQSCP